MVARMKRNIEKMKCICDGEFNEDCEYCNKLGMEGNEE